MDNNKIIEQINLYRVTKNKKCLEEIILSSKGIINYCLRNWTNKNNSTYKEDLIQEGFLAIYKAVEKFDTSKNIKFSTYAYNWVNKYMQTYIRKNTKECIIEDNYIDLNTTIEDTTFIEDIQILLEENLNPLQQDLIRLHYGFYNNDILTIKEIEEKFQMHNVRGRLQTILQKLRKTEYIQNLAKFYYIQKIDKLNNARDFQNGICNKILLEDLLKINI